MPWNGFSGDSPWELAEAGARGQSCLCCGLCHPQQPHWHPARSCPGTWTAMVSPPSAAGHCSMVLLLLGVGGATAYQDSINVNESWCFGNLINAVYPFAVRFQPGKPAVAVVSPARAGLCCHLPLSGQQLCRQAGGSALGCIWFVSNIHKNVSSTNFESLTVFHGMLLVGSLRSQVMSREGQSCTPAVRGWRSSTGGTRDTWCPGHPYVLWRGWVQSVVWSQARNPGSPGHSEGHRLE